MVLKHSNGETRDFSVTMLKLEIFMASKQRFTNYSLQANSGSSLILYSTHKGRLVFTFLNV